MTALPEICETIIQWLTAPEPPDPGWSLEDWEAAKFACRVHGVSPILATKLEAQSWLTGDIGAWFAAQYSANAQRIATMQAELQMILALFAVESVPLMPLKGSILAVEHYSDPAHRPMADLDLLIKPADFEIATRLLHQLGYETDVTHWKHVEFNRPDNRQVISTESEHPDNPRNLEVHLYCRETFGGPTIDLTAIMWAQSGLGRLLGEAVIKPEPAALWLHLLVHSSYHLWQGRGRLIHLLDLGQVTPQISQETQRLTLQQVDARFTYPTLAMLNTYFPTLLDPTLFREQQTRVSTSFQQWADSRNLINTSYLNSDPPGLYLTKALKFADGRLAEIGQALRFALLPSLDELTLDHPRLAQSRLPWLAYFLLPFDWLKRLRS